MEELRLSDYGSLIYTYECVMDAPNSFVIFNYENMEEDIKIELIDLTDFQSIKIPDQVYSVFIKNKDKSYIIKTNNMNKLINEFLYQNSPYAMHTWKNSKIKNNDTFSIAFKYFNMSIEISFDKSYIVAENKNSGMVFVYKDADFSNCIEHYMFTKNGYIGFNKTDKSASAATKDGFIDYKLFRKKTKIGNDIIDKLPTLIESSSGENNKYTYKISYDEDGIVSDVYSEEEYLSRYEFEADGNDNIAKSIYPNLYDILDPNYIDTTLSIWVEVEKRLEDNILYLNKNVYRIGDNKYNDFRKHLDSNPGNPIIYVCK